MEEWGSLIRSVFGVLVVLRTELFYNQRKGRHRGRKGKDRWILCPGNTTPRDEASWGSGRVPTRGTVLGGTGDSWTDRKQSKGFSE